MKLIDLLVQELPKNGGWPERACFIACDSDGTVDSYRNEPEKDDNGLSWRDSGGLGYFTRLFSSRAIDWEYAIITREQYEAALAASQQVEWNGEGLPPVGCECEYQSESDGWVECEVLMYHKTVVILETPISGGSLTVARLDGANFRAAPTVADKRREEFATSLCSHLDDLTDWDSPACKVHALAIYDAIAAGKIPGVKLDDIR